MSALADIEAIRQLKARYFRHLDRKDWPALADIFTEGVSVDVTQDGPGSVIVGRDRFLQRVAKVLDGSITVHHGHMSEIEVTGPDSARGIWSMEDHIWFAEGGGMTKLWGTGWYEEEYRRVDGEWRIAEMVLRRQRVEIDGVCTFPPAD